MLCEYLVTVVTCQRKRIFFLSVMRKTLLAIRKNRLAACVQISQFIKFKMYVDTFIKQINLLLFY